MQSKNENQLAKRDFGSFHSSNIDDLLSLNDSEYIPPYFKVERNPNITKNIKFGSTEIKELLFYLEEDTTFLNHGAFGAAFKPVYSLFCNRKSYFNLVFYYLKGV
jgi:isopenicillin-N epimerase